jgi:hypothetical protein
MRRIHRGWVMTKLRFLELLVILLATTSLFPSAAKAQQAYCGAYLTVGDFLAGKIANASNGKPGAPNDAVCVMTGRHLLLNESERLVKVDVKDVYALKSCDGTIIRVYKDGYYALLDSGESIPLYKVVQNASFKGDIARTRYYFSKDAGSEIRSLTADNLKAAFADNHSFVDAIDVQFRTDEELFAYDGLHKCYKLNRVYNSNK